jgi:pSer/pThr/pTyr-binding forkhead associated (FHA) protein
VTSPLERLARTAYEAHRTANATPLPSWDDISKQEQQTWMSTVSAISGQGGGTIADAPQIKSLVIQADGQRQTFHAEFTAGRQGSLAINDDFASGHHARFHPIRGLWYVEDLGSTNGTWLNGRRIGAPQLLRKGDKIKIGRTQVTVVSA